MGLSSTIIYTSELILSSTICVSSATRHNIHMYPYFLFAAIHHLKSSPTFSVRPCSSVGRVTEDLIRRSWVRFPPRSKDFFFASCGSLFPCLILACLLLFTAVVLFFFFIFACFLVRDLCRSGCRHSYHPPTSPKPQAPPLCFSLPTILYLIQVTVIWNHCVPKAGFGATKQITFR